MNKYLIRLMKSDKNEQKREFDFELPRFSIF
jgi:hypothetical protein